ncbi:MAG TPA: metal ABC transporter substrate-binding protein [Polyangia bacterium]|nr:metal ABC transporter substrate-binding protein [Polyangia bacterium]
MKRTSLGIRLVTLMALLIGLGAPRAARAKVNVVASIETLADLARQVGGDRVEVKSLARGYMDPHFVEPKPSLVIDLNRADLLVHVGLELEIGWLPPLVLGARNPRIQLGQPGNLDASTGIHVLDVPATKIDRSLGDIHAQGNPHYWIPPASAAIVAREIAERLASIDPAGKASYDARLAAFLAELERRRADWEKRAAPLRGTKIVTYHKSWSYLSSWLGLEEVGYVEPKPGIPAPPSHIAQLIGAMKRDGVKLILMESFYPRSTVDLVADKAGARALVVPSDVGAAPNIKSYFDLVEAVIQKLTRG